jgi:hypothetical protein
VAANSSTVLVTAKSVQKDSDQPKASVAHSYMCPGSAFRSTAEVKKHLWINSKIYIQHMLIVIHQTASKNSQKPVKNTRLARGRAWPHTVK